ncbi:MAG: ATP synthase F1 subunit gamma [Bacteroidota bacterium]
MAGLKEVRIRIASVKSTQQITNAMKMVAASKLRKAQNAIVKLRPYAAKLQEILKNLSGSIEESSENAYSNQRNPEKILIIPVTSNRGLCGGFNSNVIKAVNHLIATTYEDQFRRGNVSLACVGRKGSEFFSKRNYKVVGVHDSLFDRLTYDNVATFAEDLMKSFVNKDYDRIILVYNQFKNAAVQRLMVEQFLPVVPSEKTTETKKPTTAIDYIFEPDNETILRELIPKTLRIQVYKSLIDSYASEQGARMTAMQQAADNAQEILKGLQLSYNKARQAAITKEILEIVSGAEALKG